MNQHAMHCRSSLRPTISHFKIWGGGRPAPVAAVARPPYFLPTGKGGGEVTGRQPSECTQNIGQRKKKGGGEGRRDVRGETEKGGLKSGGGGGEERGRLVPLPPVERRRGRRTLETRPGRTRLDYVLRPAARIFIGLADLRGLTKITLEKAVSAIFLFGPV